jgi:hypothetical protein
MTTTETKAKITVTRCRYRMDPQTGLTPNHTEYSLVHDGTVIFTAVAGEHFANARKFRAWCMGTTRVKELGITDITIDGPVSVSLGFNA